MNGRLGELLTPSDCPDVSAEGWIKLEFSENSTFSEVPHTLKKLKCKMQIEKSSFAKKNVLILRFSVVDFSILHLRADRHVMSKHFHQPTHVNVSRSRVSRIRDFKS